MALILVAEDHPVNRELLVYLLQAHGHRTLTAETGLEALELATRHHPDLVVCDIQLPVMDGHGVARALRADPVLARTPLLAVTASAMVGDRELALGSGFDRHIAKPIDPPAFMQVVESFLRTPHGAPSPSAKTALGRGLIPVTHRAPAGGRALLFVDDTQVHLEYKRELLEPAGYTVRTAMSAEAAWPLLQASSVDLVVSDVVMPGAGGFALLQRVRADPVQARLPFVFLTSTACDEDSRRRGLALGAQAYLMRPIDPLVLLAELRAVLEACGRG